MEEEAQEAGSKAKDNPVCPSPHCMASSSGGRAQIFMLPIISQAFGGVPVWLRTQAKCSARVSHNSLGKVNRQEVKEFMLPECVQVQT